MSLRHWLTLVEHTFDNPAVNTPAFQRWFQGSKVVDEQGNPLPVFHGTFENFKVFKRESEKRRAYGLDRLGYWFDVDPETPSYFAGGNQGQHSSVGGNVMLVYLSIKKPLIFGSEPVWHEDQKTLDDLINRKDWSGFNAFVHGDDRARRPLPKMDRQDSFDHLRRMINDRSPTPLKRSSRAYEDLVEAFRNEAISEGYDGILLEDTLADGGTRNGRPTNWWIAFHSRQIKAVYANSGNYDPASDDITEAR